MASCSISARERMPLMQGGCKRLIRQKTGIRPCLGKKVALTGGGHRHNVGKAGRLFFLYRQAADIDPAGRKLRTDKITVLVCPDRTVGRNEQLGVDRCKVNAHVRHTAANRATDVTGLGQHSFSGIGVDHHIQLSHKCLFYYYIIFRANYKRK